MPQKGFVGMSVATVYTISGFAIGEIIKVADGRYCARYTYNSNSKLLRNDHNDEFASAKSAEDAIKNYYKRTGGA